LYSDDRAPIDLDALEHDMDMQAASEGNLYCLLVRDVRDLIAECRRLRAKIAALEARCPECIYCECHETDAEEPT
jgi:hypothetical protein